MSTIFGDIIIATSFHLLMLVCWKTCACFEIPYKFRDLTRDLLAKVSEVVKECDWVHMTSCAWCIGYYLSIINIIVETNYEASYKMKLQNECGTLFDLKIIPVSYLFLWCPPQYLGDPIWRKGGIHGISCKILNIGNTLKHGIYRILCISFELDWQERRGKEYSVVLKY